MNKLSTIHIALVLFILFIIATGTYVNYVRVLSIIIDKVCELVLKSPWEKINLIIKVLSVLYNFIWHLINLSGLTNTVTAVKNAQMAESPVLLLGGAAPTMAKVCV